VGQNDATYHSAIVSSRSNSVGAHDVDEDVFVDQRPSQVNRTEWPEDTIDLAARIIRRAAFPGGPDCYGGSFE
jgi:hypothetical protein